MCCLPARASLALALAASAARRERGTAPVYLSLVRARPYHPFGPLSEPCEDWSPSVYAFHLWDFFAAVNMGAPTAAARAACWLSLNAPTALRKRQLSWGLSVRYQITYRAVTDSH